MNHLTHVSRLAHDIAEPIQNGGGALVPPIGYWQELRSICDRYGVLLVADEPLDAKADGSKYTRAETEGIVGTPTQLQTWKKYYPVTKLSCSPGTTRAAQPSMPPWRASGSSSSRSTAKRWRT